MLSGGEFSVQLTTLCPQANPRLVFLSLEVKGCLGSREDAREESQVKPAFAVTT